MNLLDYSIVAGYFAFFLWLGFYFKDNKNSEDYYLGSRRLGWFPLSLSVMATQLSPISFVSAPAFTGFREGGGLKWLTYEFAVPLAMIFMMCYLMPSLYRSGVVSIYEFAEKRFNRATRLFLSAIFQLSRAIALGITLYAAVLIVQVVSGIEYWKIAIFIGFVSFIYSSLGGMKAVVYADSIQMLLLLLGLIVVIVYSLDFIGGWDAVIRSIDKDRLAVFDFSSMASVNGEFGILSMIVGGFFLYVSYYGTDQIQAQRALSSKNVKQMQTMLLSNGLARFPVVLIYCIMGLIVGALAFILPEFAAKIPAGKPDYLIPIFIVDYLPHGLVGFLVVGILAAVMSSMSSSLNSLSATTLEDFVLGWKKLAPKQYVYYSKLVTIFWGIVSIVLSFYVDDIADTVIEAINKVGSLVYGPVLAVFILAIYFKKVGAYGLNLGLATGLLLNLFLWLQFDDTLFWFWWNAIGFFTTVAIACLYSIISPNKNSDTGKISSVAVPNLKYTIVLVCYFLAIVVFCYFLPEILS